MSFPVKEERQKCWDARDRYWQCLDVSGGENSKCVELRSLYESTCPSQWVKHFDRKRNYLKFKEQIEKDGHETPACASVAVVNSSLPARHRIYRQIVFIEHVP